MSKCRHKSHQRRGRDALRASRVARCASTVVLIGNLCCLHPSALRAADLLQRHTRSPSAPCVWREGGSSIGFARGLSRALGAQLRPSLAWVYLEYAYSTPRVGPARAPKPADRVGTAEDNVGLLQRTGRLLTPSDYPQTPSPLLRSIDDRSAADIASTSRVLGVEIARIHPVPAKPPGPADRARSAPHAVE